MVQKHSRKDKMKGQRSRLRLSPNEEARIIREEKEKRRKLRLIQVREQAKINAARIRQAVKQEREIQINILAAEIKDEFEEEKAEKVRKLQEIHLRSLKHVGDAHVSATDQVPTDVERALIEQQNLQRAAQRHLEAIRKMKEDKKKKEEEANKFIVTRQKALEQEKERAAEVAAMPPSGPDPLEGVEVPKVRPIKLTDVNAFSLTHFHMPMEEYAVERAQDAELTDAHKAAVEEQDRIDTLEETQRLAAHEQQEKARLRHKYARHKELLKQDYNNMLLDLSDLRRTDISRRQQVVAKIPRSVYQAPQRRLEEKEEEQRQMEAAFEDMYMAATEHQGDLTLALDPHPPPTMTPTNTTALDLSLDPADIDKVPEGQRAPLGGAPLQDLTNLQKIAQGRDLSGLSKLVDRIKAQRETWNKHHQGTGTDRQQFTPVAPDASATTTGGSLTQYTLTSTGSQRSTSTFDDSTIDSDSTVTIATSSKVSSITGTSQHTGTAMSVTESDTTTTTEETLEEGTVTSSSTSGISTTMQTDTTDADTLLHPMELAAKVRQKPISDSSAHMASYLEDRKIGTQPNLEQLVSDFRLEQQRLEKERKKLEKKMKDLQGQSEILTPLELAQKYMQELPPNRPLPTTAEDDRIVPPSAALSKAEKVRLYQQRALERRRGRDSNNVSMDSRSSVVKTPSPQRSPKANAASVMTSPGVLSSIGSFPMELSNNQPHEVSGKSLGLLSDWSQQSYHSQEFEARQAVLKAQLAEIERQKAEITERNKQYQNDMAQTRERWQREIEQYTSTDSVSAGHMSLLSAPDTQPSIQNGHVVDGDQEDEIDEDLLRNLNDLPLKSIDHKYKIQRQKPASKAIKLPNKSPVMPHELSTIQEMDTPLTDKKYNKPLNSTELDSRKDKTPVARSLFDTPIPEMPAQDVVPQQLYQHFTKVPSEVDTLSGGRSEDYADILAENRNEAIRAKAKLEESKTLEPPAPSIDRVQEVQWLPHSTPGELVLSPRAEPSPHTQEFHDYRDDRAGISTTLSQGALTDDTYHPDTTGITIGDKDTTPRYDDTTERQARDRMQSQPYISSTGSHDETPPRTEQAPYQRTPPKPYSPTSSSPQFEFNSHYQPLKDQRKEKNWKKELAQYNLSYLTPPKTSPGRPTDKIVRCITTRAFGCERPIKGTAKTKKEMEERHRANLLPPRDMRGASVNRIKSPEENMSPSRIRQMFEAASSPAGPTVNDDEAMGSPIPKDKPVPHGFTGQSGQFLASTPASEKRQSRLQPDGAPNDDNEKTPAHIVHDDQYGVQQGQDRPNSAVSGGSLDKYRYSHASSFLDQQSITPSDQSGQSSVSQYRIDSTLSQYRLDSDTDMTKTPANLTTKTDGSLEQVSLSASSSRTASLSQYPLEESGRISGSPLDAAAISQKSSTSFHPLMEMSRSSDGSTLSGHRNTQIYGMDNQFTSLNRQSQLYSQPMDPMAVGPYPIQRMSNSSSANSQDTVRAPSQSAIDFAMDISQQAQVAMEKYNHLRDESRKLREQYEREEETLMAETKSGSSQQSSAPSSRPSTGRLIEQNLSRSLERLAQEETGISEEPDITLVSAMSTPQKASTIGSDSTHRSAGTIPAFDEVAGESQATSDPPRSLLSFEQHEISLQTTSQGSLGFTQSGGTNRDVLTPYASTSSSAGASLAASGAQLDASGGSGKGGKGVKTSMVQESQKHMSHTLASWKKNNALGVQGSKLGNAAASGLESVSMTTKTSADQKKKEREMKQRTERLYGQLEDVKQQKMEKQRKEEYAMNRQRQQEYQKNFQEQLKKKMQHKK